MIAQVPVIPIKIAGEFRKSRNMPACTININLNKDTEKETVEWSSAEWNPKITVRK